MKKISNQLTVIIAILSVILGIEIGKILSTFLMLLAK